MTELLCTITRITLEILAVHYSTDLQMISLIKTDLERYDKYYGALETVSHMISQDALMAHLSLSL